MKKEFLWLVGAILLALNLLSFTLCVVDKRRARKNKWRISEAALLTLSALGGSLGLLIGMAVSHHKTSKLRFALVVPLMLMVHVGLAALLLH